MLRVVFMGTAEIACPSLQALLDNPGCDVLAVVTQPDRPKGRDLRLQPPPVKQLALQRNIDVLQPEKAREPGFLAQLGGMAPDLIVVMAYGQLLPQVLLDIPRLGCLNLHTSLLPKYRGAAPIQWAIANGDATTGVTLMKMDAGLDTGPIVATEPTIIAPEDDAQTLHDRLGLIAARLLSQSLSGYSEGRLVPQTQPTEGVSVAPKIRREDGRLDWTMAATILANRIRAFTPWPGAFTHLPGGAKPRLVKIWKASAVPGATGSPGEVIAASGSGLVIACARDALGIHELQLEGARRLPVAAFLAGHPIQPGLRF
jgi:methionyl-tRNA formyltransferase